MDTKLEDKINYYEKFYEKETLQEITSNNETHLSLTNDPGFIIFIAIIIFLITFITIFGKRRSAFIFKTTHKKKDMIICIASYMLTSTILFIIPIFIIEEIIRTRITISLTQYTIIILIISIYINKIILNLIKKINIKINIKIKPHIIGIITTIILILISEINHSIETSIFLTTSILLGLIIFIIILTTIKIIIPEKININQINPRLRELSIYAIIIIATFFDAKLRTLGLAISFPQIIITIIKLNRIKTN